MSTEKKKQQDTVPRPQLPNLHRIPSQQPQPVDYQRQFYQPEDNAPTNYCYAMQKNKPQSNSVAGALMVMLISGIHIGWGICTPQLRYQEWHLNTYPHEYTMVILSWYLGAILGSLLTVYIYTKFTKREIYYFAGGLCVISSALFMGLSGNAAGLIIARALAGIAHGFAYITGICHASENSVKEYRGMLVSSFHYMIIVSAFMVTIILPIERDAAYEGMFDFNILIGGLCLLYALLGVGFVPCLTFESVVYLIQRQQYRQAIENMIKLRSESVETWEIKNDFDEMKLMVAEDLRTKPSIFKDGNTRPLILILLTKIVLALGFNYAINMIRVSAVSPITTEMWSPGTIYGIRFLVFSIFMFLIDVYGRRKLFSISTIGAGSALVVYGIIYVSTENEIGRGIPILIFEIFAAIGMHHIPDVLMSEAFPITKKILSMTLASVLEYSMQILIIAVTYQMRIDDYLVPVVFTIGGLLIVLAVFLYINLPETRVMSLRQARSEFRKKYDDVTFNREQLPSHINNYS